jgi:hypothetical protein
LHFVIEMTWRSAPRGVHTTITIRPARKPIVWYRVSGGGEAILDREGPPREHLGRILERETAFGEGGPALGRIKRDGHT